MKHHGMRSWYKTVLKETPTFLKIKKSDECVVPNPLLKIFSEISLSHLNQNVLFKSGKQIETDNSNAPISQIGKKRLQKYLLKTFYMGYM